MAAHIPRWSNLVPIHGIPAWDLRFDASRKGAFRKMYETRPGLSGLGHKFANVLAIHQNVRSNKAMSDRHGQLITHGYSIRSAAPQNNF